MGTLRVVRKRAAGIAPAPGRTMVLPLQIVFRHMEPSMGVKSRIRERVKQLERFAGHIMSCRVAVEPAQRRHHQGNLFRVRVDLKVPRGEVVAGTLHDEHHAHEDVYVAIRDAFDAARRQLEDYVRKQRGQVKVHRVPGFGLGQEPGELGSRATTARRAGKRRPAP